MAYFRKSIAVLGGGITGLAAAYRLTTLGHRARIFEASARLGGAIRTELTDGWLVESGPTSFREDTPEVGTILHELGLGSERIEASPSSESRYLARDARLVAAPRSLCSLVPSRLFSARAKLRILAEICERPRVRAQDVSVAELVRGHFGSEVLERAAQPLVSGIWAGDAAKLSARAAFPKLWEMEQAHGSLLRGQMAAAKTRRASESSVAAKTISFRRGLQTLSWSLTSRLPEGAVVLNSPIESLARGNRWQVSWQHGNETHRESFDAVVAPLPAGALARLQIGGPGERPLAALAEIEHPPLASLFLGFRREQVSHALDGYGLLLPATERRSILGAIFSSSLFPGRAPAGCVALTVFAGGALQPEIARRPLPQLLESVRGDLRDLLGVKGEPVFVRHAFWPKSIPQYNIGHQSHRDAITSCEKMHPGLFIGGQAVDGISVSQCISAGCKLAERADLLP